MQFSGYTTKIGDFEFEVEFPPELSNMYGENYLKEWYELIKKQKNKTRSKKLKRILKNDISTK